MKKKLITEKDVCDLSKQGVKRIDIDENTMITAAAEDAALSFDIDVVRNGDKVTCTKANASSAEKILESITTTPESTEIDPDLIFRAVEVMAEGGFLKDIITNNDTGDSCTTCNCSKH